MSLIQLYENFENPIYWIIRLAVLNHPSAMITRVVKTVAQRQVVRSPHRQFFNQSDLRNNIIVDEAMKFKKDATNHVVKESMILLKQVQSEAKKSGIRGDVSVSLNTGLMSITIKSDLRDDEYPQMPR